MDMLNARPSGVKELESSVVQEEVDEIESDVLETVSENVGASTRLGGRGMLIVSIVALFIACVGFGLMIFFETSMSDELQIVQDDVEDVVHDLSDMQASIVSLKEQFKILSKGQEAFEVYVQAQKDAEVKAGLHHISSLGFEMDLVEGMVITYPDEMQEMYSVAGVLMRATKLDAYNGLMSDYTYLDEQAKGYFEDILIPNAYYVFADGLEDGSGDRSEPFVSVVMQGEDSLLLFDFYGDGEFSDVEMQLLRSVIFK